LHVDAAFGAYAALSPDHAHLVAGLDAADSVCIDLHKWLNVPYDSAVQYSRHPDLQPAVFGSAATYLPASDGPSDFLNLTPENSRRLRALATWFTLCAYGQDGHRAIVQSSISCAEQFGDLVKASPAFELLDPVRLNIVCFTLADTPSPDRVAATLRALTESGEAFLTPTVHLGTAAIRAAFTNWRTTSSDVERVFGALESACLAVPSEPDREY
jgi:glutamate/tyrosine decarboxylase-like PLP-dependent enzyme